MALKDESEITIPVCYGESIVDGLKIFEEHVKIQGEEYYSLVYVLAEGPIYAFNNIRLNEIELFNKPMNVKSGVIGQSDISAKFKDHVQVELWNGEVTGNRIMMIEQNSNSKWKSTATLNGRAAVCLKIRITDSSEIKEPDVNLQAKIKGLPVLDIRFQSTTPVYDYTNAPDAGTNPVLCLFDYLINDRYGSRFSIDELDVDSFIIAANWCEVNSLTFNGIINQSEEYKKIIENMLTAFRGRLTRINGIIQCILDIPAVSVEHFNLDTTINKLKIEYHSNKKYFNQLEVSYNTLSFDEQSITVLYPPTNDDPFILKDNRVIKEDLKLPFTRSKIEVDFLASMMVRDNLAQTEIEFETLENGFNVAVNDVFTISLDETGWDKKAFRAVEVSTDIFGDNPLTVKITAREYKHEVFDDAWDGVVIPPVIVDKVPAPTNLKFEFTDSKYGLAGLLSWDKNVKVYESQVMYKLTAEPDTSFKQYTIVKTNEATITSLKNAYYDFYVVNRNLFNKTSDIVYLRNVNCYDATLLPKVTNLKDHSTTADFVFTWDDMLNADIKISDPTNPSTVGSGKVKDVFAGYEIDVIVNNKIVSNHLVQENNFTYTFENNARKGLSRNITVEVSIVAKQGARSQVQAIKATNQQQPVPNGLKVEGGLSGLNVSFDAPQQTDHKGVLVHLSKTRGFIPDGSTLLADLTATNFLNHVVNDSDLYFVRVGAYDCFGKDSIVYSPEFEVSIVDVSSMLADISSDQLSQDLLAVITGKADTTTVDAGLQAAKDLLDQKVQTARDELQTAIDNSVVDLAPVNAKIIQVEQASVNADNAITSLVNGLVSTTNSNTASIASLSSTVTNNNTSIASRVNTMESSVTTLQAPSGLAHRADITVMGDANTYYPVYFKYGNQDFTRRLIIQRSYFEQAPVNWSGNTTHKGGLVLDILGNWGGWGGQLLDWRITELKQQYSTMYGGAEITGSNMMFVVWLRGGEGVYHLHSDQALDVQIGYSTSDIIRPDANPAYVIRALPAKTSAATAAEINAKFVSDKAYIGLDQVDNKSSATIVSEASVYTNTKYNEAVSLINTKDSAQASLISSLTSTVNGHTSSITSTNNTIATLNGRVNATWALRLAAGNKISGIGLANDGTASTFSVLADSFKIYANGTDNAVFAVENSVLVVKSAHIGQLDASNIKAGAINAAHLSVNAINAVNASIGNASIGFAKIADDIKSNNFVLNSTGWQLTKSGALNATGINVQGYIFGSHIKGGLVEGAVVFGNEGYIQATVSDTGSGVRYGCYPRLRYDVTVDSTLNSWSPYVEIPLCSHDYSGDGTQVISNITVANNFYRSRTAYPEVSGKIDIDCSRLVHLDVTDVGVTFNIHMDVSSVTKTGTRALIAQHLLCDQTILKQSAGSTQTYQLLSGWGGYLTVVWGDVSHTDANGNNGVSRKIVSCIVTITSMPTTIVYSGNKRAIQFRCHSGATNRYIFTTIQPSTMSLTVKGQ